ncbi:MAG: hypothetical protein ACI4QT_07080 [Kiritimatiellia bacterium]
MSLDKIFKQARSTKVEDESATTYTDVYVGTRDYIEAEEQKYTTDNTPSAGQTRCNSKSIEYGVGDVATLTVVRIERKSQKTTYDPVDQDSVVWSMTTSQITYPIERYCGPSGGASAQLWEIRAWQREPDSSLYNSFQFRSSDMSIKKLSEPSMRIAAKIAAGIDSVMRFYPTIKKVSTYGGGKIRGLGENLAYIDTPGSPYDGAANMWLKTGDDVQRTADGSQIRTETWIGSETIDANLYGSGSERWEFGSI